MKKNKIIWFVILNIIVLLVSSSVALLKGVQANKIFTRDVVTIIPKRNETEQLLSLNDLNTIQKAYPNYIVGCQSQKKLAIEANQKIMQVKSFGVNSDYFQSNFLNFIDGSGWHQQQKNSIVLSNFLAYELFGNEYAVGQTVKVDGAYYSVTGVVHQKENYNSKYVAWLPINTAHNEPVISTLFIKVANYNYLLASIKAKDILLSVYKNPNDYYITDMNLYINNFEVRLKVFLHAVWLVVLGLIAFFLRLYFLKNTPKDKKTISIKVICTLVAGVISLYTLLGISRLIEIISQQFINKHSLFDLLTNKNTFPSYEYLPWNLVTLTHLNTEHNIALTIGLVALINLIFWIFSD